LPTTQARPSDPSRSFLGALQEREITLRGAMAGCIAISGLFVTGVMIWLGYTKST
jgi:hypothetical protein